MYSIYWNSRRIYAANKTKRGSAAALNLAITFIIYAALALYYNLSRVEYIYIPDAHQPASKYYRQKQMAKQSLYIYMCFSLGTYGKYVPEYKIVW